MTGKCALLLACSTLSAASVFAGCMHAGPNPRTLHYIGADLVASPVVDHRAYAAYLQAELAFNTQPPDLGRALEQISLAIGYDRDDAHLWTVRGEIELRRGDLEAARRSSAQAIALRPGYPPAQRLAARLGGASGAQVVLDTRSVTSQRSSEASPPRQ